MPPIRATGYALYNAHPTKPSAAPPQIRQPLQSAYFSSKEDAIRCELASWRILAEINNLIYQSSEDKIFKTRLGKITSAFKAARQFEMQLGPPIAPIAPDKEQPRFSARNVSWARDIHGNQTFTYSGDGDKRPLVLSCDRNSRIARCALKLWRQEQASLGAPSPYRASKICLQLKPISTPRLKHAMENHAVILKDTRREVLSAVWR